ncbi:PH, RCC1 and FYVE domains-containing protein 1 [Vitis vinifera]|uniref:PH, RCC1 and FYVE domains-containing protein 1 n=1 Tax=Vitis vinifera TaxID=29760 RepID=A0A438HKQ9_VITVI|nr:PH, RCC1 and FYVE domains-containing protein 1 [Vitis vinifera]
MSSHISFRSQTISCFFSHLLTRTYADSTPDLNPILFASSDFLSPLPLRFLRFVAALRPLPPDFLSGDPFISESLFLFSGRAVSSTPKHCCESTASPRIVTNCEHLGFNGVVLGVEYWWRVDVDEGGGVSANLSHGMADLVSYGNAERDVEQKFDAFVEEMGMGRWSFEFCGLFMEYQLVVWLKFVTFERIGCGDVLLGLVLEEFDIFLPVNWGNLSRQVWVAMLTELSAIDLRVQNHYYLSKNKEGFKIIIMPSPFNPLELGWFLMVANDLYLLQALIALKKGAQLLKYGRKGKPKFCPFRLSNGRVLFLPSVVGKIDSVQLFHDESSLIWISSSGERILKLASVSRIIPGQRTAVFQRYLRPEKDYLSFSLIYNGKRSLDLVGDLQGQVEAEVWIAGLKALISSGQGGRSKIDGWSDGGLYFDFFHAIVYVHAAIGSDSKDLTSNSPSDSSVSATRDISSPEVSVSFNSNTSPNSYRPENSVPPESHGSAPDDCDALGDVYIWGEVICDNLVKVGADKNANYLTTRADLLLPKPLESNVVLDVHHIACGVRHAALVTRQGEVFTWGEESGGRLGHGVGRDVIQPRLVESLAFTSVDFVACGEFHTCAVTMAGELFTWGDGTHNAGLLGHGTDVSHWIPKRISGPLEGLQVASVTCGPWHTALVTTTRQLFTFGDGTFGVLGHGDKDNVAYQEKTSLYHGKYCLWPTWEPQSDGKLPCFVEDKLLGECVEEIACGAYHVAVLTSRNEDRHVKYIACGSNYTAAICLHKWVSGAEQSQCSTCRQAFGFTRKRHNCYNCGLVHCHSCSSRKALRAALAPNPGKPYRENKDRLDKAEIRLSKSAMPSNLDLIKQLDSKAAKQGKKADTFSLVRPSQAPLLQLKDVVLFSAVDLRRTVPRPILTPSGVSSRSVSPFSRKPSPPRSATPVPTTSGLSFSKSIADSLKKTNELLNQEVLKLRGQVESLRERCELQELELQKSAKKVQEAMVVATEESAKSKAAKEVIKSLTAQVIFWILYCPRSLEVQFSQDMAERLPPGVYDAECMRPAYLPNGLEPNGIHYPDSNGERHSRSDSINGSCLASPTGTYSAVINGTQGSTQLMRDPLGTNEANPYQQNLGLLTSNVRDENPDIGMPNGGGGVRTSSSSVSEAVGCKDSGPLQDGEGGTKSRNSTLSDNSQVEAEWIEQYEPGVYITLVALRDGTRDLKRVRFRYLTKLPFDSLSPSLCVSI